MTEGMERRLAAIVAADIAGYSRLIGADEEGTLRALRAHRAALIDPLIARHGGKSTLTIERGDGEERIETDDALAALRDVMADGDLERFRVDPPDLEAVFLNLTGRHLRD